MERQIKLSSDFILFVWMVVLVVFVLGGCAEDSDINPRTEANDEVTEFDYRFMDTGEDEVETIQWQNNLPKNDIASPDTVPEQHVNSSSEEEDY